MNLRAITHLDTFNAGARFHKLHTNLPWQGDTAAIEGDTLAGWKSLGTLMGKSLDAAGIGIQGVEIEDVHVIRLPPKSGTAWRRIDDPSLSLFLIPFVTNPAVRACCGLETAAMPVGSLWWINAMAPHSLVNDGVDRAYILGFKVYHSPESLPTEAPLPEGDA